jgi:hypothetical protein
MGYACPVCDEPQRDAEHLANHLAFQAMTYGDEHESWLDDHAPDWASGGPADLAPRIVEFAPEADYEVVFDDTTVDERGPQEQYDPDLQGDPHATGREEPSVGGHGHTHSHTRTHASDPGTDRGNVDLADLDPETRTVVEKARDLTREMLADDGDAVGDDADADDATDDGDGAAARPDRATDHE